VRPGGAGTHPPERCKDSQHRPLPSLIRCCTGLLGGSRRLHRPASDTLSGALAVATDPSGEVELVIGTAGRHDRPCVTDATQQRRTRRHQRSPTVRRTCRSGVRHRRGPHGLERHRQGSSLRGRTRATADAIRESDTARRRGCVGGRRVPGDEVTDRVTNPEQKPPRTPRRSTVARGRTTRHAVSPGGLVTDDEHEPSAGVTTQRPRASGA
jgi:hypothetical protein